MPTCYILCNIHNVQSEYIVSNYAGSSLSFYLGNLASQFSKVVFVNVGAPSKKWDHKAKSFIYKNSNYSIIEFSCGLSFLPTRFKAKYMLKAAINFLTSNKTEGDYLLVYHSLSFCKYYERLIRTFGISNTIIHIAELYSEVGNISYSTQKEIEYLKLYSKYIFMSKNIADRISPSSKHMIIYGSYNIVPITEGKIKDNFDIIYAGTSSKIKGGLYAALKASKYLPKNYTIHIFSRCDSNVLKEIQKYDVVYEGYVDEKRLLDLMKEYDIGLATQNPDLLFNNSSFPSKIVNYLACGLNVISSRSKSVADSPFNDYVYYYEEDGIGKNLADAIIASSKQINKDKNRSFIMSMNEKACAQMKELFEIKL